MSQQGKPRMNEVCQRREARGASATYVGVYVLRAFILFYNLVHHQVHPYYELLYPSIKLFRQGLPPGSARAKRSAAGLRSALIKVASSNAKSRKAS